MLFGTRYPIVAAPMGGVSSPDLVAAVSNAGGLGSVAAAYLSPPQIEREIGEVRARTDKPFGVNLFTVDSAPLDRDPAPMLAHLNVYHRELGIPPATLPPKPAERFAEQVETVLALKVPVFSFTFGIPDASVLEGFRSAGTAIVGTATTVREAVLLEQAGVDAIALQGAEAGAHRGTFHQSFEESMVPMLDLVRQSARAVRVPLIAAGGIMDGGDIRAALDAGAKAAQLGTAFIPCPESVAAPAYKEAVLSARQDTTTVTRAFSGRPARGIRNRFIHEVEARPQIVLPFPWQNAATRPMRAAAAKAGCHDFLSLWAGQGVHRARAMPAVELLRTLVQEMNAATTDPRG